VDDGEEAFNVVAQALWRYRRVLDECDGFGVFLHRHGKAQRSFAQAPDTGLSREIRFGTVRIPEAPRA
jgi:hypothetical protein